MAYPLFIEVKDMDRRSILKFFTYVPFLPVLFSDQKRSVVRGDEVKVVDGWILKADDI